MKLATVLAITLVLLWVALTAFAQQPPAQPPTLKPVSELTRLSVANAYQKVINAQQALSLAINAYNTAVAQGAINEKLTPEEGLQFDPQSERVIVVTVPKAPSQAQSQAPTRKPESEKGQAQEGKK